MYEHPVKIMPLIKRVDGLMQKRLNNNLMENGITGLQMDLLVTLTKWEGKSMKLKEAEKYYGVSQASMASLVSRLEKNGLVEGYVDPDDKRVKRIRLTVKGEKLCQENRELVTYYEQKLVEGLSSEEKKELETLLLKLYNSNKEGEV